VFLSAGGVLAGADAVDCHAADDLHGVVFAAGAAESCSNRVFHPGGGVRDSRGASRAVISDTERFWRAAQARASGTFCRAARRMMRRERAMVRRRRMVERFSA